MKVFKFMENERQVSVITCLLLPLITVSSFLSVKYHGYLSVFWSELFNVPFLQHQSVVNKLLIFPRKNKL